MYCGSCASTSRNGAPSGMVKRFSSGMDPQERSLGRSGEGGLGRRDRLGRAGAAGVRARTRSGHQRVRRGLLAVRCGHRGDPRRAGPTEPRRAAGRGRARVQPHPQWRHAAQHPPDGRAVRDPHAGRGRPQGAGPRRARVTPHQRRVADPGRRGGRNADRVHRAVLRSPDQGRRQPQPRAAGRRVGRAVHPADVGPRRRAQEDRRSARRCAPVGRRPGRGGQPHAVRRWRRLRGPHAGAMVRHASRPGGAHPCAQRSGRRLRQNPRGKCAIDTLG